MIWRTAYQLVRTLQEVFLVITKRCKKDLS